MFNKENIKIKTLVVEDDRLMSLTICSHIEKMGHEILTAQDGKEAINIINSQKDIDMIVLDRVLPKVDGLEIASVIKKIKHYSRTPIIMVTGSNNPEQIKEGIDSGVFYYLTKPINAEVFLAVVKSAENNVIQRRVLISELERHKQSFHLMNKSEFLLKTIEEARDLAIFLANCYPDSAKVVSGITELILNAVEHGNLEIGYDKKTELLEKDEWQKEVNLRKSLPLYASKKVTVAFAKEGNDFILKVTDEGEGFDWKKYLDIDPSRALDSHGRGIVLAKSLSFDEVIYNKKGNEVTAIVKSIDGDIDW